MERWLGAEAPRTPCEPAPFGPASVLRMQATAGNRAVTQLIQRETSRSLKQRERPKWFRLDAAQDTLPGDPVLGVTGVRGVLAEGDRPALQKALADRRRTNEDRLPGFMADYMAALFKIWGHYLTSEMRETVEHAGWSFQGKLVSFVIRASLLALFPEIEIEGRLSELVVSMMEKGSEMGLEQAGEALEEGTSTSPALERREDELNQQTDKLSTRLKTVIKAAFRRLLEGEDYKDWLDRAPVSQLHLFRLPPEVPERSEQEIERAVAAAVAGFLHEDTYAVGWEDFNIITVLLSVSANGRTEGGAYFRGAKELGHDLLGITVGAAKEIPLYIELRNDLDIRRLFWAEASEVDVGERPSSVVPLPPALSEDEARVYDHMHDVIEAYPSEAPAVISRHPGGHVSIVGGGVAEHYYLYELLHPGSDLGKLLRDAMYDFGPVSPRRTPEIASQELFRLFVSSIQDGAELVIDQSVDRLTVGVSVSDYDPFRTAMQSGMHTGERYWPYARVRGRSGHRNPTTEEWEH